MWLRQSKEKFFSFFHFFLNLFFNRYVSAFGAYRKPMGTGIIDNFISWPGRTAVVAAVFDDWNNNGIWIAIGDNEGGISFSHVSDCSGTNVLSYDFALNYTDVSWIGIDDSQSDGSIGFVAQTQVVQVGQVSGVNGVGLGVKNVMKFMHPMEEMVGFGENRDGQRYYQSKTDGLVYNQSVSAIVAQNHLGLIYAEFSSFRSLNLQFPYLNSKWGAGLVGIYNGESNRNASSISVWFADDEGLSNSVIIETKSYSAYSFKVQPTYAINSFELVAFVAGVRDPRMDASKLDGLSLMAIQLSQQVVPDQAPKRNPKVLGKIVYNEPGWEEYFLDAASPSYVETVNGTNTRETIVSILLDGNSGAGILDFDLRNGQGGPIDDFGVYGPITDNQCYFLTENPNCRRFCEMHPLPLHLNKQLRCYN